MINSTKYTAEDCLVFDNIKYYIYPVMAASKTGKDPGTPDSIKDKIVCKLSVSGTGNPNQEIFISYAMLNNNKTDIINMSIDSLIANKIGSCICDENGDFSFSKDELGFYKDIETDGVFIKFTTFTAYVIWCYRGG